MPRRPGASEPPRTTVPPARIGSALPLPQVLDGDVAPLESLQNVLEVIMEASELDALAVEEVGGPGASEEDEEAMKEHAQA